MAPFSFKTINEKYNTALSGESLRMILKSPCQMGPYIHFKIYLKILKNLLSSPPEVGGSLLSPHLPHSKIEI